MISNSVSHVRKELTKKLDAFLDDSYIINVVLSEIEQDVVTSFINKYVDKYENTADGKEQRIKDGTDIPVLTNFPQTINDSSYPFIYIGMGDGKEDIHSIGTSSSGYDNTTDSMVHEHSSLTRVDNTTLGISIQEEPDLDSVSIPNFSYGNAGISYDSSKGLLKLTGLYKPMLDDINYEEDHLYVNYTPLISNARGNSYGIVVDESVSILIVSNNMDEIRILDSIIKASLIIMRNDDKEMTKYSLASTAYGAPAPLEGFATSEPSMIFGREILVNYKVDYTMDKNVVQNIKSVNLIL